MASEDLKNALAGLGSTSPADVELSLIYLDGVAATAKGMKLLCSKEIRRKIAAFVVSSTTKITGNSVTMALKLAVKLADSSGVVARALCGEIGTKPLVNVLRRSTSTAETTAQACELLHAMIRSSRKMALSLRLDGGIEALCHILSLNPDHHVLRPACFTLALCCDDNDNNIRIAQKKGGVKLCLSVLRARGASAMVCAPVVRLLATLCVGVKFRAVLLAADAEAYALIVNVLKRHVEDVDVAIGGLGLLNSLANDAESAMQLCEAGAFPAAWSAVVRHVGTAAVGRQAMSTIWKLVAVLAQRPSGAEAETASGTMAGAFKTLSSVAGVYSSLATEPDSDKVASLTAATSTASAATVASSAPLPAGTVLTLARTAQRPGIGQSGPPTTLTNWALPYRYLQWYPAALIEANSLPRWAGAYLPRPGWYPPIILDAIKFKLAYAVIRPKVSRPVRAATNVETAASSESKLSKSDEPDDSNPAALSFFGVRSSAFADALAEGSAASDLQSQLKHQITALLDDDGLFRPARPAPPSRSPDSDAIVSPTAASKPVQLTVKPKDSEEVDGPASPLPSSPYKTYRTTPVLSHASTLPASPSSSMLQLVDARAETGTVSLNRGAMGKGISFSSRPPGRTHSALPATQQHNELDTPVDAGLSRSADSSPVRRRLVHAQSMSDMLSPASPSSQFPLPSLTEKVALRRWASKPDVRATDSATGKDELLPRVRGGAEAAGVDGAVEQGRCSPSEMSPSRLVGMSALAIDDGSVAPPVDRILRDAFDEDTTTSRDSVSTARGDPAKRASLYSVPTSRTSSPVQSMQEDSAATVAKPPLAPRPASANTTCKSGRSSGTGSTLTSDRPPTAGRVKLRVAADVAAARRESDAGDISPEDMTWGAGKASQARSPIKKAVSTGRNTRTMSDLSLPASYQTSTASSVSVSLPVPISASTSSVSEGAFNGEKPVFRRSAFDMAHAWLSAPHWFPELQTCAAVAWDLAPMRSLFWRVTQLMLGEMAVHGAAATVTPEDDVNILVADYIKEILRQTDADGSAGAKGLNFPARKIAALHPSKSSENALAARHVHNLSIAFTRAICSVGPFAFDERRVLDRRIPSSLTDMDALPSSCKSAVAEAYRARSASAPSKVRVPRVYLSPSGVVSVRKFVIPATSLPTAFHAMPPTGKILGLTPRLDEAALKRLGAVPSTSLTSAATLLTRGYAIMADKTPDGYGREADLPEPMVVCTAEQRAALVGKTMLQTIARAGVAAGQLMRHRFLGGSSESASEPEGAAAEAAALAPLLYEAQAVTVYHRYADMMTECPSSSINGAVIRSGATTGDANPQTIIVQYPYPPQECAALPPPLPQPSCATVVPLQAMEDEERESASDSLDKPDDVAPLLDTFTVESALLSGMPPPDPAEDFLAEEDDEDSQGSDEDVEDPGSGETKEEGDESTEVDDKPEKTNKSSNIAPAHDAPAARMALPAALQTALLRASRHHLQRVRELAAPVALSKKDVMRVLSEAADEVQGVILAAHGGSSAVLGSIATKARRQLGTAPESPLPAPVLGRRVAALAKVPPLEFDSRFETGNLCAANRVGPLEYELSLDPDTNTSGHTQWFFFRVRKVVAEDGTMSMMSSSGRVERREVIPADMLFGGDAKKGGEEAPAYKFIDTSNEGIKPIYKFHIVNLEKGGSSFNDGMRPLVYFQHGESTDLPPPDFGASVSTYVPPASSYQASYLPTVPGEGWRRGCFDIIYYRNQYSRLKSKAVPPVSFDDGDDSIPATAVRSAAVQMALPVVSPQYSETWSITFPPGVHTVYLAYCYPYTYTDLRRDVVRWERRALRHGADSELIKAVHQTANNVPEFTDLPIPGPGGTADPVKIREFDVKAALQPVDGMHNESADPAALKYAAFSGFWIPSTLPFAPRPGLSMNVNLPLGTFFCSDIMHRTNLCYSLSGNPVPLLTITDFSSGPIAVAARPYIILSGRVHPGESNGSWMLRGVIDFLTSSAPVAVELRRRVIFKVIPILNPDGVINGHHRTNLAGLDLNRHWSTPELGRAPTIWHLRTLIMTLQSRAAACSMLTEALPVAPLAMEDLTHFEPVRFLAGLASAQGPVDGEIKTPPPGQTKIMPPVPQPVLLFVDFHGHSRRQDVFTFGCHELTPDGLPFTPGDMPADPPPNPSTRLFPRLLSARIDTFSFKGCSWKVQRDKYNCARVAMWRDAGLSASYTIEATFSGSTTGSRRGVHMNTRQFEDMGHAFCMAMLDWVEGPQGDRHASAYDTVRKIAELQAQAAAAANGPAPSSSAHRGSISVEPSATKLSGSGAGSRDEADRRPKTASAPSATRTTSSTSASSKAKKGRQSLLKGTS